MPEVSLRDKALIIKNYDEVRKIMKAAPVQQLNKYRKEFADLLLTLPQNISKATYAYKDMAAGEMKLEHWMSIYFNQTHLKIMCLPLEEVPLHIGESPYPEREEITTKLLALWRLEMGI